MDMNNPNMTPQPQAEDAITAENKAYVALSWIPIISWIMYLVKKEDKAVVRAANQGLIGLIAIVAISIFSAIFSNFGAFGSICCILFNLCDTVVGIFCLVGLIKACMGEHWEMPLLGSIKIFK